MFKASSSSYFAKDGTGYKHARDNTRVYPPCTLCVSTLSATFTFYFVRLELSRFRISAVESNSSIR